MSLFNHATFNRSRTNYRCILCYTTFNSVVIICCNGITTVVFCCNTTRIRDVSFPREVIKRDSSNGRNKCCLVYNNFAHSTTYPDGVYQDVKAQCYIKDDEATMTVSSEIAGVYPGKMKSLVRTAHLAGPAVEVKDHIETEDNQVVMVWNMTTEAVKFERKKSRLLLTGPGGEQLEMLVSSRFPFTAELVSAKPAHKYEGQNNGISFLRLRYTVPSWTEYNFSVKLNPLY